jgi:putative ABC transport system permease protein
VKVLVVLAARSAWNRRLTLGMMMAAIAMSVLLLLGVQRIREDARESFTQAISGTDLVVGARTSPVQLLLSSVFHIGSATQNMTWKSFEWLKARPAVQWAVPLSLGDSHRGFPVLGTTPDYFAHVRFGASHAIEFAAGKPFESLFEAVIGAEVARQLGYRHGDKIVLSHGSGVAEGADHDDKPFSVVGVLARTGTPVDRTVHVGLEAIEAIHLEWQGGAPIPGLSIPPEHVRKFDLRPKAVTGALVGLKNRSAVFREQRAINEYTGDALLAILPGVTLDELWDVLGLAERVLLAVSILVAATGFAGLVAVILAGLNERRRELSVLRAVGAQPRHILALVAIEGSLVTLAGAACGALLLMLVAGVLGPQIQAHYGLAVSGALLSGSEALWLAAIIGIGFAASLFPGYRAYRLSLADGLTPRL